MNVVSMRPPESWSKAPLTLAIAAVTFAAWAVVALFGLDGWAVVSASFWPGPERYVYGDSGGLYLPLWITPLTATLIHSGPIHILFNLLVLVFCGRPVESVLGSPGMGILYVLGAYAAAGVQYALGPNAAMVGASGAVSAVIGAYAILFGRNKVKVGNPRLARWLNALWLMAAWVLMQLFVGIAIGGAAFLSGGGAQIAVGAHIGGFLVGVLLANPLLLLRYRKA